MIAKSFERIHRSNLVGMGIIPLCFKDGEDAETLGLTGHERYTIDLPSNISEIRPGQDVTVTTDTGKSFTCTVRFDTEVFPTLMCIIRNRNWKHYLIMLKIELRRIYTCHSHMKLQKKTRKQTLFRRKLYPKTHISSCSLIDRHS